MKNESVSFYDDMTDEEFYNSCLDVINSFPERQRNLMSQFLKNNDKDDMHCNKHTLGLLLTGYGVGSYDTYNLTTQTYVDRLHDLEHRTRMVIGGIAIVAFAVIVALFVILD